MRPAPRRTAAVGAACIAVTAAIAASGTAASAASSRSALPGSQPSWANSKALRSAAPAGATVHARVYLPFRNRADLDATAAAVSTPGNARYQHFLTPAQFRQKYAPSQGDVAAVTKWLRGTGLTVVNTPDNGRYVAVEGTVAQAQTAFGTTLGLYSVRGRTLRAPETAPSVPADLAGTVEAVVGLDDTPLLVVPDSTVGPDKASHGAPGAGYRVGTPCSTYFGEKTVTLSTGDTSADGTIPIAPCGYTPAQVRGLYGLGEDDTGAGQTVAFVGANASPTIVQDVTRYSRLHNLPDPTIQQLVAPGVYRHPDTPRQTPGDFYGEETLDAEAIHTTAPDAKLLFVGSSNAGQDFDAAVNHIVDKHLASILSISYGWTGEALPRGFINSLNGTFAQAVATGIGVFVSSGDDGDDAIDFGRTAVDFFADSPNVTAVGGTSAGIVPADDSLATSPEASQDPRSASALYGLDNPNGPLNSSSAGWHRSFEVGWQTSLAPATGALAPKAPTATQYVFTGDIGDFSFQSGAGGGVSRVFARPSYQQHITAADGTTPSYDKGRAVPDISALADPNTGFLVGQTQAFSDGTYYDEYRLGGTSLAAPLMAGIAAVANQKAGTTLGFLNPRIYAVYDAQQPNTLGTPLYDVDKAEHPEFPDTLFRVNWADGESAAKGATYSVRTLESPDQTLHSGPGYDTATGVGTPNGTAFLTALRTASGVAYAPSRK